MIGRRNRRIAIWEPTGAVDSANEPLPDAWALHKERWADVKGETGLGSMKNSDGINTPLDRYSFRICYTPSITIAMQVRERDGTRAQIVDVRHDKADREWTDIVVVIGGANG